MFTWTGTTMISSRQTIRFFRSATGRSARMSELDNISSKREQADEKLVSVISKVYEAFLEMERSAFSDWSLPKKTKELTAIGISIVIDCESCMKQLIEQAAKRGANENEIREAMEVGMEMGIQWWSWSDLLLMWWRMCSRNSSEIWEKGFWKSLLASLR